MSVIMNDVTSMVGQRIVQKNTLAMKRSLEKLSTGMRTKSAGSDSTVGLAMSEAVRTRIFGMDKALYNSQDGLSLIQTANGALDQTQSMLRRMRDLSAEAANDVLTKEDRSYIQVEINEVRSQINVIAESTQFGRKKILSGDNAVLWSGTDSQVKAVIKGGLRSTDQFGQKYAVDGNFRILVSAEAGQPETQRTEVFSVGQEVADGNTKLRDIDQFRADNGEFILAQPKELTLTQGDGTQAKVTLYAGDTLDDAARKLNTAIAVGLGQSQYVDDAAKFAAFEEGTIVIRSAVAGERGRIALSGNEDVLRAFSLTAVQEAEENQYSVSVIDAHDDSVIAENVRVTGNRLVGVIHRNIDVELGPMAGINVEWDAGANKFVCSAAEMSEATLHLSDNTTVFQTGASEGDDVLLNIGDMSANALGLGGVNVMSRERAEGSVSLIDAAIDRVSMQQAGLGAAQNRLERHISKLTKETAVLTDADIHIGDTAHREEILEYSKGRILEQSNSAMLAQSNGMQRSRILGLLK